MASDAAAITVDPVDASNWRSVADLSVRPDQEQFVAPVLRYLALCAYGGLGWIAHAIRDGDDTVGFVMAGTEEADNSYWIGGLVIDATFQRRGYGRRAVEVLIEKGRDMGCRTVALSYDPANAPARTLYAELGFVETGEMEGDEIVARLDVELAPSERS